MSLDVSVWLPAFAFNKFCHLVMEAVSYKNMPRIL